MVTPFINENFLLQSETARRLYHTVAVNQPVIDYHNHLQPNEISEDINFSNLTHIWLEGDHYKWRAMRACGVDENLITGDATDREKFIAWAQTVPKLLKNPLYHWSHMELARPFGITDRLLNGETAGSIWDECNEKLQSPEFSCRSLLRKQKIAVVATTDNPIDTLEHHVNYQAEENNDFTLVPTFRPDHGMNVEGGKQFVRWVKKLEQVSGVRIRNFTGFIEALKKRHDFFHSLGCRASDHGIDEPYADDFTYSGVNKIFKKALRGKIVNPDDARIFKSAYLYFCGLMNHEKGWVFQLHIGAQRDNNSRMLRQLGPNAGYDCIADIEISRPLTRLLDRLDSESRLPKTVLYNLNPRDNELIATILGIFQDGLTAGKMQHGPPWWFLDQKDGIEKHIESLANMGVLSEFIGMTTDSRSFLSLSRHEYFRRIFCNIIGNDAENGLIPSDFGILSRLIEKVCYTNAKDYFKYALSANE
ncbi:MAG: glucuronate isomerase [Balneolaceae bacterium]|nr:MAG: glucuronate isomerase [Balneolaceae bacterium]